MFGIDRHGVCSVLDPRSSASKVHEFNVKKPTVFFVFGSCNGTRNLAASCNELNGIHAEPIGMAVCETFSRTS